MERSELFMLIDLLNLEFKGGNLTKLAKELNTTIYNPIFQRIKNYLIIKKIIKISTIDIKNKIIIKIDKKKLYEFIPELEIVRKIHDDLILKWAKKRVWIYE